MQSTPTRLHGPSTRLHGPSPCHRAMLLYFSGEASVHAGSSEHATRGAEGDAAGPRLAGCRLHRHREVHPTGPAGAGRSVGSNPSNAGQHTLTFSLTSIAVYKYLSCRTSPACMLLASRLPGNPGMSYISYILNYFQVPKRLTI